MKILDYLSMQLFGGYLYTDEKNEKHYFSNSKALKLCKSNSTVLGIVNVCNKAIKYYTEEIKQKYLDTFITNESNMESFSGYWNLHILNELNSYIKKEIIPKILYQAVTC